MSCVLLAGLYSTRINLLLPSVAHILSRAAGGGDGSVGRLLELGESPALCFCASVYSAFLPVASSWAKGSSSMSDPSPEQRAGARLEQEVSEPPCVPQTHTLAIKHSPECSQASLVSPLLRLGGNTSIHQQEREQAQPDPARNHHNHPGTGFRGSKHCENAIHSPGGPSQPLPGETLPDQTLWEASRAQHLVTHKLGAALFSSILFFRERFKAR